MAAGQSVYETSAPIPGSRLRSGDDPYLYIVAIKLCTARGEDQTRVRLGSVRSRPRCPTPAEWQPHLLLAALDQDLHPDTVYTVPLTSCVTSFRRPTISGFNCLVVRSNCQTSGTSDSGLKLVAIASAWVVALADTTARDTDYIMRRLMRRRRNSPRGSGAMANGGWRAPAMIQSTTIAFVVS